MRLIRSLFVAGVLTCLTLPAPILAQTDDPRGSVVKIFATVRSPDLVRPWSKQSPGEATGTGFVIDGERIITNAHVVRHASQLFVQPPRSSEKYRAEVVSISSGIDLAVLELTKTSEREVFFAEHPPLPLVDELPEAGDMVKVYGFPMGGEQLSVTEGVLSRIDYANYYNLTLGLRLQVDTALNPGNSGGPGLTDDGVVGVVFSQIRDGENIGYLIPTRELLRYLDDFEDGVYDGPERRYDNNQTLENPAIRNRLGLDSDTTGLMINRLHDESEGVVQPWDVLTAIGEHDIDNTGLIELQEDVRVSWLALAPTLVENGTLPMTVFRDGELIELDVPAITDPDLVLQYMAEGYPEYFLYGPMVFTPAYAEHFQSLSAGFLSIKQSPIARRFGTMREFEGEQLVVVAGSLLPHPITKGYEVNYFPVVDKVNGVKIRSLAHLVETLNALEDDDVVFEFADLLQEILVWDREEIEQATEEILDDNGIRNRMSDNLEPLWTKD